MYICVYVYTYMCVYIYIYIYIYMWPREKTCARTSRAHPHPPAARITHYMKLYYHIMLRMYHNIYIYIYVILYYGTLNCVIVVV